MVRMAQTVWYNALLKKKLGGLSMRSPRVRRQCLSHFILRKKPRDRTTTTKMSGLAVSFCNVPIYVRMSSYDTIISYTNL